MEGSEPDVQPRQKWLKLGLIIALLHYLFLALLLVLLRIDQYIAIALAVGVSFLGGVALVVFVVYENRR